MKDLYEKVRQKPKDICLVILRERVDDSTRLLVSRNITSSVWRNIERIIRFDGAEISDFSYVGHAIKNKTYTPLQMELAYEKC